MVSFHLVDDTDPRLVYSGSWILGGDRQEFNQTTHGTVVGGSQARFTFNGSSVEVYGTITNTPIDGHVLSPFSTYSIDGSSNVLFNPVPTSIQYQQLFYQSPTLENTQHVLLITSFISNSALWLDFFRVGTADTPPLPTSVLPSTNPSTSHPQSSSTRGSSLPASAKQDSTSVPAGVIVGGVIGSLVSVILMGIVIWLALRKRAPRRLLPDAKSIEAFGSKNYPKHPTPTSQEYTSMLSIASSATAASDPHGPSLPISGNMIRYKYQQGGLITMTATPSGNSPYGGPASGNRSHETTNESFTQVLYYQNEKSMPLRVVDIQDIPPAYASSS